MARSSPGPSGHRIEVPCDLGGPAGHHRWVVRRLAGDTDAWDWMCRRCRRWYLDVIETPATDKVAPIEWKITT